MKTLFLSIAFAIALTSCSTEPNIEMRTINPQLGVNVIGTKEMIVKFTSQGGADVHTLFTPETKSIVFNPKTNVLLIDGNSFEVIESTHYTITYKDNTINTVIEFNTGYVWQGGKTKTNFDIYKLGEKNKEYTVYSYNN